MDAAIPAPFEDADRRRLLVELGAATESLPELLDYTRTPYRQGLGELSSDLPLAEEPHLEAWRDYAAEAASVGAAAVLRSKLVQLELPIREGISREPAYRAATLRGQRPVSSEGVRPPEGRPTVHFEDPAGIEIAIHPTLAGAVPVVVARRRADFETLYRALARRNEPVAVPAAMGACLVKGLVNWDRVARHRAAWAGSASPSEALWQEELRRLARRKELYQDRVLLLSTGPYAALAASELGRGEAEWLADSLCIRRDHECFHYLTLRLFGLIRSNLLDELLADAAGLLAAYGRYRGTLALRFLGLERSGELRPGARLDVYRGDPPLSDKSLAVLPRLATAVISNLERILAARRVEGGLARPSERAAMLLALAGMGLEELADDQCEARFRARWQPTCGT